jgi:hypothetical protein
MSGKTGRMTLRIRRRQRRRALRVAQVLVTLEQLAAERQRARRFAHR